MWIWALLGCGDPAPLAQPNDPPAWPLQNLSVPSEAGAPNPDEIPADPPPVPDPASGPEAAEAATAPTTEEALPPSPP